MEAEHFKLDFYFIFFVFLYFVFVFLHLITRPNECTLQTGILSPIVLTCNINPHSETITNAGFKSQANKGEVKIVFFIFAPDPKNHPSPVQNFIYAPGPKKFYLCDWFKIFICAPDPKLLSGNYQQ